MLGVGALLAFLLLATQVSVHLYATSTVRAVAYDAARQVAGADVDHDDPTAVAVAARAATADLRAALGQAASRIRTLRWDLSRATDVIVLDVEVDGLGRIGGPRVTASVRARVEEVR